MPGIIAQAMRDHKLSEKIVPPKERRLIRALPNTIDEFGNIFRSRATPFRTPITYNWIVGDGERHRIPRAGTAVLVAAIADTPPSTGQLIIRFYQELYNETGALGESIIHTLYVPEGYRMYEYPINFDLFAGAWIRVDIVSLGGASDVSAALVENVG